MHLAVVGAGPAGALFARLAVADGARVTVFDASHPREKPCGGGVTAAALDLLPPEPDDDPLPARFVDRCRFESDDGHAVSIGLPRPVAVASRLELDAWLLRRAIAAGAVHVAERVSAVEASGRLRTTAGRDEEFDLVVGADGAGSLVRRTFLGPLPPSRVMMAAGWFAQGSAEMVVRFAPELEGYLWLFPRPDHVGVGVCGPLGRRPTREMLARLETIVARSFPAMVDDEAGRYAHTIPSPTTDPASLREIAGDRWALLGDAAALADPITGEGIQYAFRSARLLADTLRSGAGPRAYAGAVADGFGRELLRAAAIRDRFQAPGFSRRMVRFAARSGALRQVLADLVLGEQGYLGLKRRLVRTAPRFVLEYAAASVAGRLGV